MMLQRVQIVDADIQTSEEFPSIKLALAGPARSLTRRDRIERGMHVATRVRLLEPRGALLSGHEPTARPDLATARAEAL
jgi:hypothetical protein